MTTLYQLTPQPTMGSLLHPEFLFREAVQFLQSLVLLTRRDDDDDDSGSAADPPEPLVPDVDPDT